MKPAYEIVFYSDAKEMKIRKAAKRKSPYAVNDRSHNGAFVAAFVAKRLGRNKRNPYQKNAAGGHWACYEMGWKVASK